MSESKTPCAACKLQRRRCTKECVFAPYFSPDSTEKFEKVHQVFGASNVAKILTNLGVSQRAEAVRSLVFEAEARCYNPAYGCVGSIFILQQQMKQIAHEIEQTKKELAIYEGPTALQSNMLPTLHSHHKGRVQQQGNNNNYSPIIREPQQQHQRLFRTYDQQQPSYDNFLYHGTQGAQQDQGIGDDHNMQRQHHQNQHLFVQPQQLKMPEQDQQHQQQQPLQQQHQQQEIPEDPNDRSAASC